MTEGYSICSILIETLSQVIRILWIHVPSVTVKEFPDFIIFISLYLITKYH